MLILFFLNSTHTVAHAVSWSCGQRLILSSSQSRSHTSQVLHYPNSLIRTDCCSLSPEMKTILHCRKKERQTDLKREIRCMEISLCCLLSLLRGTGGSFTHGISSNKHVLSLHIYSIVQIQRKSVSYYTIESEGSVWLLKNVSIMWSKRLVILGTYTCRWAARVTVCSGSSCLQRCRSGLCVSGTVAMTTCSAGPCWTGSECRWRRRSGSCSPILLFIILLWAYTLPLLNLNFFSFGWTVPHFYCKLKLLCVIFFGGSVDRNVI